MVYYQALLKQCFGHEEDDGTQFQGYAPGNYLELILGYGIFIYVLCFSVHHPLYQKIIAGSAGEIILDLLWECGMH